MKPRSIVARFLAGADPAALAYDRCARLHDDSGELRAPCDECIAAIYAAIRRGHKRAKAGESRGRSGK